MELLEQLIDEHTLNGVLNWLVSICYDKADDLRAKQDKTMSASMWEQAARSFQTIDVPLDL